MNENVFTLLENDIKDVISRFGIHANLFETEYGFTSDTFGITPNIFKNIRLKGDIHVLDGEKCLEVTVTLDYRYETFGGGMNGTDMCSIYYYVEKGFEKSMGDKDNYRWLFKRRFITMP